MRALPETEDLAVGAVALDAQAVRCVLGGVVAVDDVSLRVDQGRCVALVGESGAGKTTLLRCFNRMVVPAAGAVLVGGTDVTRFPAPVLRRRIGYVPQHGGLLPHWRVLRNVALVPDLLDQADATAAARRALDLVGLPPDVYGARFPHELSGGQRQRVALARAIAARPGVLLMDEPFGALDAVSRSEVQAVCAALRRELGVTTLLVTHDLLEADFLADEIVVMRAGRVEQRGTLDAMRAAPATPYVASLLERALAGAHRRSDA
ncbi:ATP-binding cassette domain-containing protein [Roseisolibacter sp. H3M3-2]|uniref:ATP-binding cassette domain-containing protein n=1 Tax=Roseisolibacter sp. H3M3-2 TaxID=3031323 RepID=UPI0023DA7AA5|nr:ATP-binding cassette domain-containing protein [Roseisolibacter sp. H3M3-2]MDF1502279.1 ATP-binding cassette domain-containing protein [Roseisolibacter sp. H3M3-2]